MEQRNKSNHLVIIKLNGANADFLQKIVAKLQAEFTVLIVSKIKPNDDGGFHVFVTVADLEV
jgi:hypothetical protein